MDDDISIWAVIVVALILGTLLAIGMVRSIQLLNAPVHEPTTTTNAPTTTTTWCTPPPPGNVLGPACLYVRDPHTPTPTSTSTVPPPAGCGRERPACLQLQD